MEFKYMILIFHQKFVFLLEIYPLSYYLEVLIVFKVQLTKNILFLTKVNNSYTIFKILNLKL